MSIHSTRRSLCITRIAPVIASLALAATANISVASPAGQAAIVAEIANIPTVKPGTPISKLKSNDLLLALCLALENPANAGLTPADLAVSALETRSDKDKLADDVIGTTIATVDAGANAAVASSVTVAVFSQAGLSSKGQPVAIAGGLAAITESSIGNSIGLGVASAFTGSADDLQKLLEGTVKATGSSTGAVSDALANLIDGLFDANEIPAGDRSAFITSLSQKVAGKNPDAAGGFFGGLVLNNPNGGFDSDAELQSLATGVISDKKLGKAIGDILGNTLNAHTNKAALTAALIAGQKIPTQSLIVQGILRSGVAADVSGVLAAALPAFTKPSDRVKAAGIVADGNGDDAAKLNAITSQFAASQTVSDKSNIGIAIINAVGADNPEAAKGVMGSLIDSAGGVGDPLNFAISIVPKLKSFAAAGAASAEIADRAGTVNGSVNVAAQLMAKAKKAATDIAQQISALSIIADRTAFAGQLADSSPKFVQNIAVGVSITDPDNSDVITANVVTHDPVGDKGAISKVGTIAGAVAAAVDEENAAAIAASLGNLMSDKGATAGKPIKVQSAKALATAIAKAIQSKPGVLTVNRMDELGELAAVITNTVITSIADPKARAKAIKSIGSAIAGVLSKKPVNETKTLLADTSEARDIAGSMAQVVMGSGLPQADIDLLLGPDVTKGAIGKGVLPKSGKKGTTDYNNTVAALTEVRDNPGSTINKFENGSVTDKETDTKNG